MTTIKTIHAREILDSRGNPTLEAEVTLSDGSFGRVDFAAGPVPFHGRVFDNTDSAGDASRSNSTACRNETPWAVITQSIGPPPRPHAPRQCHRFLLGVITSDGLESSWNGHAPTRSLPCLRSTTPQPSTSRCTDTSALSLASSASGILATANSCQER